MEHDHSTTSNTNEGFRTFIGCQVKGFLRQGTFDGAHADILVFHCGWGLAFNSNGAHWTVTPDEVKSLIREAKEKLTDNQKDLKDLLELAGEGV